MVQGSIPDESLGCLQYLESGDRQRTGARSAIGPLSPGLGEGVRG